MTPILIFCLVLAFVVMSMSVVALVMAFIGLHVLALQPKIDVTTGGERS